MMLRYASLRDLRRRLIVVPFFSPRLSSGWVHLVTPIPSSIARPLVEGLRTPVVVQNDAARRAFPQIVPVGYDEAVRRALDRYSTIGPETTWFDAFDVRTLPDDFTGTTQGMLIDRRQIETSASRHALFTQRLRASAASAAGSTRIGCGSCAASSTAWSAASARAGAGVPRRAYASAMRSISGASKRTISTVRCVCARRCGCRAGPGSNSKSSRTTAPPTATADGVLRAARLVRLPVLVFGRAVSRAHFRPDGAANRGGSEALGFASRKMWKRFRHEQFG